MSPSPDTSLEWSEEILREMFLHTPIGVVLYDLHGTIFDVNAAACALIDYPRALVVGRPVTAFTHPAEAEEAERLITLLREGGTGSQRIQHRLQSRTGRSISVSTTVSVVRSQDEAICGIAFIENIGEQVRIERALRESESLYRQVVEDQTEMIVRVAADGTRTFANQAYARFFGIDPAQLAGTSALPVIAEEDRAAYRANLATTAGAPPPASQTYRVVAADGTVRWTEWTNRALFGLDGRLSVLQSIGRDVTERMQVLESLRSSETRFRTLFEDLPVAAFESDWTDLVALLRANDINTLDDFMGVLDTNPGLVAEGFASLKLVKVNSTALAFAQVADAAAFDAWRRRSHQAEYLPAIIRCIGMLIVGGAQTQQTDQTVVTDRGEMRRVLFQWSRLPTAQSEWHIVSTIVDLTERERMAEALRASEQMYRQLFHSLPVAVWETDWSESLNQWNAEGISSSNDLMARLGGDGVERFVPKRKLVEVNSNALALFGLEDASSFAEGKWSAIHPQHLDAFARAFARVLFGESRVERLDSQALRIDGTVIDIELTLVANPVFRGRIMSTVVDLTHRKKIERDLKRSGQLLERAQSVAHLGSWDWNRSSGDLTGSGELWRLFGLDAMHAPLSPAALAAQVDPSDVAAIRGFFAGITGVPGDTIEYAREIRITATEGAQRVLQGLALCTFGEGGRIDSAYGSLLDITERKHAEEWLRESEAMYRLLFDNLPVAVWETDWSNALKLWREEGVDTPEAVIAWLRGADRTPEELATLRDLREANQNALQLAGASSLAEFRQWLLTVVRPEDVACVVPEIAAVVLGLLKSATADVRTERVNGESIDLEMKVAVHEGLPGRIIATAVDTTEKKRIERELLHSQRLLERAQAITHIGSWEVSLEHDELFGSREYWKIMDGYDHGPRQRRLSEALLIAHPDDRTRIMAEMQRAHGDFMSGLTGSEGLVEFRLPHAAGMRLVRGQGHFSRSAGGEVRGYGVLQDITDQRKAEEAAQRQREELTRADRMISLGVLVSGVAHEINNPNHLIMLNAPLLRNAWNDVAEIVEEYALTHEGVRVASLPWEEMRDEVPQVIDEIDESAGRIRTIVAELRGFGRDQQAAEQGPEELNAIVRGSLRLLANHLRKATTRFVLDLSGEALPVRANARRLEQVIVNLVLNSCQSLEGPDCLVRVSTALDRERGRAEIRVKDEGKGIPPDDLSKIRDPFFTTKRAEGGMGLGLAVSERIVQEHNGLLAFESVMGEGTTAIVSIPVLVTE